MRQPTDVQALIDGVLAGRRRDLARLLSAVEAGDHLLVRSAVTAIHGLTGSAHTIGITGSPGVGKSTLTAAVVAEQRRRGRRVAVIAVDPSSPFSGGALLGDRVRMADHATDEGVFIRSMASRGHLGGLSWAAPHALSVMDAAGFDVVVVETVGVGQAEVEIASVADTTIVVLAPGMGDAIQAAKAGIMEIADVLVVNKADRPQAEKTARELASMLELRTAEEAGWVPPICRTVADREEGVVALVDALDAHQDWARTSGHRRRRKAEAARLQVREIVLGEVRRRVSAVEGDANVAALIDDVAARRTDPYAAADRLLAALDDPDS